MEQILYNREKCIGCGTCVIKASAIWQMSLSDGKADLCDAEFKKDNYIRMLWPDEKDILKKIVDECPTKAIKII